MSRRKEEKLPLLWSSDEDRPSRSDPEGRYGSRRPSRHRNRSYTTDPGLSRSFKNPDFPTKSPVTSDSGGTTERERVTLQKSLTLAHAVVFIVVNVTGTGIFVTPTGVTAGVGSVGATFITWVACGLYNLSLALCYSELGTAFPIAGGDYVYIQRTVGNLMASMCLYIYVFIGPVAAAVMTRTFGEYLLPSIGLGCSEPLMIMIGVILNMTFAAINTLSVKATARSLVVFTWIKAGAFGAIIIIGLVQIGQGKTENFQDPFSGSNTEVGTIILGVIPGFISYGGWDMVCSLAGEMKNPKRDLPLSLVITILSVIGIYVMMNVAYFTVLTPQEFIATNAVGLTFATKTLPAAFQWVIPLAVCLSAAGALAGIYLGFPRYTYAGAKDNQLPEVFSYLSINYMTPLPGIVLQLVLSIFFSSATFFNIQQLFLILGVNVQLKIGVAMVGLLILKIKMPDLERTLKVPLIIVIVNLILVATITVLAVYRDPYANGIGVLLFLSGIPLYYIGKLFRKSKKLLRGVDAITLKTQQLLLCVPTDD